MTDRGRAVRVLVALGGNAMIGPDGSATPAGPARCHRRRDAPRRRARRGRPRGRHHPRQRPPGRQPPGQERARRARRAPGAARLVRRADAGHDRLHPARRARGRPRAAAASTRPVAALVTRTLVDADDDGLHHARPSRSAASCPRARPQAAHRATARRWEDRGEKGWRRVVASPEPLEVLDAPARARRCSRAGLRRRRGRRRRASRSSATPTAAVRGVEAVIDKDLAAALLARTVDADVLVIATDVAHAVARLGHARGPRRSAPSRSSELRGVRRRRATSPRGSMGPKVDAALPLRASPAASRSSSPALDQHRRRPSTGDVGDRQSKPHVLKPKER